MVTGEKASREAMRKAKQFLVNLIMARGWSQRLYLAPVNRDPWKGSFWNDFLIAEVKIAGVKSF